MWSRKINTQLLATAVGLAFFCSCTVDERTQEENPQGPNSNSTDPASLIVDSTPIGEGVAEEESEPGSAYAGNAIECQFPSYGTITINTRAPGAYMVVNEEIYHLYHGNGFFDSYNTTLGDEKGSIRYYDNMRRWIYMREESTSCLIQ